MNSLNPAILTEEEANALLITYILNPSFMCERVRETLSAQHFDRFRNQKEFNCLRNPTDLVYTIHVIKGMRFNIYSRVLCELGINPYAQDNANYDLLQYGCKRVAQAILAVFSKVSVPS